MTALPIAQPPADVPSKFENFLVKYRVHVGFLIAAGVLIEGVLEKLRSAAKVCSDLSK